MNISYISNSAVPSRNASSIQIIKMCESFSLLGHNVKLIIPNTGDKNQNIFKFYGVKNKFKIKKLSLFNRFPRGLNYYFFAFITLIYAKKFKTDLLITRNFFVCFLSYFFRQKIIFEIHHGVETEGRVIQFLLRVYRFLNFKNVIKIVAISKGIKDYYVSNFRINGKKILVYPSGSSIKKKNLPIQKYKKLKIGYFGTLYKSRGLDLVLKLSKIDSLNDYYIFGGSQKDIDKIKRKNNQKNLYLSSYQPYNKISELLMKVDISILPYVSNITVAGNVGDITKFTSPLKLFDYMACGKIILCSNYKVLREVLTNKNAIFIDNYRNPFSWKMAISKVKNSPKKNFIMGKNNYIEADKYNLKRRARNILEEKCIY
tara:strand:+ start:284 stop:1399 length:1116 start_codon:yes stop_codon:yes gene_type:complete